MPNNDDAEIDFEVGHDADEKIWRVTVTCSEKLSEDEFAACIIDLGKDILEGAVSFEEADEIELPVDIAIDRNLN